MMIAVVDLIAFLPGRARTPRAARSNGAVQAKGVPVGAVAELENVVIAIVEHIRFVSARI